MEHEAFAHWLNNEIQSDLTKLNQLLQQINQLKSHRTFDWSLLGREYSLFINQEEVMVKANHLNIDSQSDQGLDDDFYYYDEESIAFCGLEDFEIFLHSYLNFLTA